MAVKNIAKRKKRTALTMLGIFVGIAAVVALVSLGQGLQQTVNAQFEKVGADKLIIQAASATAGAGPPGQGAATPLKDHELSLVSKVHGVVQAAGYLARSANVQFNNVQRTLFLASIPKTAKEAELVRAVATWEADTGRLLSHKDKKKVVVGYNLGYNELFQKNVVVGDKLKISNELYDVVGILKHLGDPGADGGIILAEDDARQVLNETEQYSLIVAQSAQGENPDTVASQVEKTLRRDRHQKEGKEDFSVQTSTELIASFNTVLNIIQVVFVGIAAISLLVGGIGIANTMFTAVLERTREIGIMKAIGARNSDVLWLFLIESGTLGLVGGIIGVLLGATLSKTIEWAANTNFGPGTIYASFSPILIIGALLFSFILGALSGVLPARRASLLRPVDALRNE